LKKKKVQKGEFESIGKVRGRREIAGSESKGRGPGKKGAKNLGGKKKGLAGGRPGCIESRRPKVTGKGITEEQEAR